MKRQLFMPLGVVWLAAVATAWLVTTPLLAVLIQVTAHHRTAGGLMGLAAISATFACVVVGGPMTAVALWLRRNHGRPRAVLSGLATGVVVVLFLYSYLVAAGEPVAGAWQALPPLVIITSAELALALALRRYCREVGQPQAPPSNAPPDQPEESALTRPAPRRSTGRASSAACGPAGDASGFITAHPRGVRAPRR